MDHSHIVYVHGSGSDKSQTYKARILRDRFPGMLTPNFEGDLPARMAQLRAVLGNKDGWTLIGSSLGGLMAAIFAMQAPSQVRKLVLLAPALAFPEFTEASSAPILIPTIVIHGTRDALLPLKAGRKLAEKVFTNLTYLVVDDDHRMHHTAETLDWNSLLI